MKVIVNQNLKCTYIKGNGRFMPNYNYPELYEKYDEICKDNIVFEMVRNLFVDMKLDEKNIGKKNWNPLSKYIKKGDNVLLKPNMVMDKNLGNYGEDCLYTNVSVVAAILVYVFKALDNTGSVIVADAPVQQCNFENLLETSGYNEMKAYFDKKGFKFSIKDLRGLKSYYKDGNLIQEEIEGCGTIVDLGKRSYHYTTESSYYEKIRITNYDPNELFMHHNDKKHEYYIANDVLNADVIINIPKPKAHRKAGVTIGLKNFVGANVRKEYLPHHRIGDIKSGGDEYNKESFLLLMSSKLKDKANISRKMKKYRITKVYNGIAKIMSGFDKRFVSKEKNREGSWYGNDTIWRTILDINAIVQYGNKNGKLEDKPQRKIINIADMIVVGEKEGPLLPSPKKCGVLVFSEDIIAFDYVIATIMGFDYEKIPTLNKIQFNPCKIEINSNNKKWNSKKIQDIRNCDTLKITPSDGWKNHIEK